VAPSTPPGQSGLAVVRLSGPDAVPLVDRHFTPAGTLPAVRDMAGYTVAPGDFAGIDEVVVTVFLAPRSFTGEDVVEISCHGGPAVKRAILRRLLEDGAVLAEPGEFSRRAFLNGKIDLVQAEAIMNLIGSEANRQVGAAYQQLKGHLSERLKEISAMLYAEMAAVELILEFPDHEAHDEAFASLEKGIMAAASELSRLVATYERGRLIQEGARVVIYGEPNVGKSSLLNAFVGQNRAIVTDIPGTTRDTIEFHTEINGYKVILVDTAGVRETSDPIEKEGVRRSVEAVADADLLIFLFDSEPTPQDIADILAEKGKNKGIIVLFGKDDLRDEATLEKIMADFCRLDDVCEADISVLAYSALRAADQDRLAEAIGTFLERGAASGSELTVTSARHKLALDEAVRELEAAASDVRQGVTLDLVAVRLRVAAEKLSELTGDDVSESLVDTIFSAFCVGK